MIVSFQKKYSLFSQFWPTKLIRFQNTIIFVKNAGKDAIRNRGVAIGVALRDGVVGLEWLATVVTGQWASTIITSASRTDTPSARAIIVFEELQRCTKSLGQRFCMLCSRICTPSLFSPSPLCGGNFKTKHLTQ